jgi:hypothetical protein
MMKAQFRISLCFILLFFVTLFSSGCAESDSKPGPPPPIIEFTSSASSIVATQPVVLSWTTSANTTSISISPEIGDLAGMEIKSVTVFPESTTTYVLSAKNKYGTSEKSVTVTAIGKVVDLPANEMLYDSTRDRIVASVPSSAGLSGNSIALIDPNTGNIENSVFVGSEPNKLALSDDASTLYVGLDGATAFRRFDMNSKAAGPVYQVGEVAVYSNLSSTATAGTILILPGTTDSVAIAKKLSFGAAGVTIYDSGIARANSTQTYGGNIALTRSDTPNLLYGLVNGTGIAQMTVDGGGVFNTAINTVAISGNGADMVFSGGRLYFTSGEVINSANSAKLGTYVLSNITNFQNIASTVLPDAAGKKTYFTTFDGKILAFGMDTFIPLGSLAFNQISRFSSLIRCGGDKLAVVKNGKILIFPATAIQ